MINGRVVRGESEMFFNSFTSDARRLFNQDKEKFLVLSWIIFNTNYKKEYKDLKMRECYFSYSVIEEEIKISHKKALRIIKELEEEGFINWVFKSKTKYKKSILELVEKRTGNRTGEDIGNANLVEYKELVREPVKELPLKKLSTYNANDIEELWKLYPRKTDKKKAFEKIKKLLNEYSKEELTRCIQRYSKEVQGTEKKFILMGSTFFNSRYFDYLDSNYNDIKPKEIKTNVDYVDEIMKEMYERGEF